MFAEIASIGGRNLGPSRAEPRLRRKYAWMKPVFGSKAARWAQRVLPETKSWVNREWDKPCLLWNLDEPLNARAGPWASLKQTKKGEHELADYERTNGKDRGDLERTHGCCRRSLKANELTSQAPST